MPKYPLELFTDTDDDRHTVEIGVMDAPRAAIEQLVAVLFSSGVPCRAWDEEEQEYIYA